jgi:hypothetical protein
MRGWSVQAFDDFEAAFVWLSSGEGSKAEEKKPSAEAQKVPVHAIKDLKASARTKSVPVPAGSRREAIPVKTGKIAPSPARRATA